MFFLIAGVQPKTKILDAQPRQCPRCGLHQAVHQRIDHYASLFFIPLFRVRKGAESLFCRHCSLPVQTMGDRPSGSRMDSRVNCPRCGGNLSSDFAFCPHCGQHRR